MSQLDLNSTEVELTLRDGSTVTSCVMDLYYEALTAVEPIAEHGSTKEKMVLFAQSFNSTFDKSITWGEAAFLFETINDAMENVKKNSGDLLTSPTPTT